MQLLTVSRWEPCNQSEFVFVKLPLSHALPVVRVCACVCVPSHQAGKIQSLNEEERAHLLPLLHNAQWVEVVGRDAIYKEFIFKDFNQVFIFIYVQIKTVTFTTISSFSLKDAFSFLFFPFRLSASCPE